MAPTVPGPGESGQPGGVYAALSATGPGDGVLVVRAMASSRGGLRPTPASEPTPDVAPPTPTPVATATPAPEPAKEFKIQSYRVAAGDTLLTIAERFGITPETVLWANDIRSADLLQVDQDLKILPVSGVLHTVRKGESLGGIADDYLADRARIVQENTVANADALSEGQLLVIPGGMRRTTEISGPPSAPSAQEMASATKYTVKPGDTLLTIADDFGVRVSAVQAANGLMDPDLLQVGLAISIPGGVQRTPAAPAAQPAAPAPKPQVGPAQAAKPADVPAPAAKPTPAPAPAPKPTPVPPSPPAAGDAGDQVAAIAEQFVGYRYLWGGHSPSGFDCSGFTWYVYKQAGISIPLHDLAGQLNAGPRISRGDLEPGDLVLFQNTYKAGLSHSGIYLGGGRFINAETEASGVQVRSLSDPYWSPRFVGGSRPR